MNCSDCNSRLNPKLRKAVTSYGLKPRCLPCQFAHETQNPTKRRPEEAAMAVASDYDSTREHWEARQ